MVGVVDDVFLEQVASCFGDLSTKPSGYHGILASSDHGDRYLRVADVLEDWKTVSQEHTHGQPRVMVAAGISKVGKWRTENRGSWRTLGLQCCDDTSADGFAEINGLLWRVSLRFKRGNGGLSVTNQTILARASRVGAVPALIQQQYGEASLL